MTVKALLSGQPLMSALRKKGIFFGFGFGFNVTVAIDLPLMFPRT